MTKTANKKATCDFGIPMSSIFSGSSAKNHLFQSAENCSNDFTISWKPGTLLSTKILFQHVFGSQSAKIEDISFKCFS